MQCCYSREKTGSKYLAMGVSQETEYIYVMKNINLYLLTWNIQDILPNEKLTVKQYYRLCYVIYHTDIH